MQLHHLCVIAIMGASIAACQNNNSSSGTTTDSLAAAKQTAAADSLLRTASGASREIVTSTGKTVVLETANPRGASLTDITVYFKHDTTTKLTYTDKDPVSNFFAADLDGNGFDEVYVITTAAGSGSYGNVCAFSSNKDLSFSFVYIPELEEADLTPGKPFHGYEGHDEFKVEGNKLVRTFRVSEGDQKSNRTIRYQLKKGEAGFMLVAEK